MIPLHLTITTEVLGVYIFVSLPSIVCGSDSNHLMEGRVSHTNEARDGVALDASSKILAAPFSA